MNEIKIFENKEFGKIRVIEKDGKILFCGSDLAKALGYAIPSKAVNTHCKGVSKLEAPTNGGFQNMLFVDEGDVYRLIIHSKLPSAEKFESWVFNEVLPSIRKNGGYIQNQENLSDDELMAKAILVAQNKINEKNKQIENMKPNYLLGKAVSGSNKSIEVGFLANILVQNGRKELGRTNLFKWFRKNGYLSNKKGLDWNRPTYKSTSQDLFEVKENIIPHNNGYTTISFTPLVTPKGQRYFIDKFIYKGESL